RRIRIDREEILEELHDAEGSAGLLEELLDRGARLAADDEGVLRAALDVAGGDELAKRVADLVGVEERAIDELARRDDVLQAATLQATAHRDRHEDPRIGPHVHRLHRFASLAVVLRPLSQGAGAGTVRYFTSRISVVTPVRR